MASNKQNTDIYLQQATEGTGFVVFFVSLLIALVIDTYSGYFSEANILVVIFLMGVLFIVSFFQWKNTFKINDRPQIIIAIYTLVWLSAISFFIPPGSIYIALGAQVAYQTYIVYGKRGVILSIELQVLTIAVLYYWTNSIYTIQGFAEIVRSGVVITMLTITYVVLLDVTRKEIERVNSVSNKLFTTSQRMELMVNSMNEAMIATDVFGKIVEYNLETQKLVDKNEDLHGKFLNEILDIHNEDDETVDVLAQARAENKVLYRNDLFHRYGKGDSARLSITANPIILTVNDEQVNGFTFIISDITKKMSLEDQRDEFISVVSHELRTPVAVAEGNLEIAKKAYNENKDDESIGEKIDAAQSQVKYLSELVNDLVVLSMSEEDQANVKIEKFSPGKLAEELQQQFIESANSKSLGLSLNIQDEMKTIESSRVFINEIIKNFLTNAIKYSDEGEVVLHVTQDQAHTTFAVQDSGRGISKSDQQHIFEKFYRAEEFHTRETGGTGLGLHVVLQLASKISGDVTFESELEKGSTFRLKVQNHLETSG